MKMRGVSLLLLSLSVFAQNEVSVSVRATPERSPFFVDGHRYTSPQFFSWKEGTQHTLTADGKGSWTDSFGELGGIGRQVTVEATAEVTEYRVSYAPKPVAIEKKLLPLRLFLKRVSLRTTYCCSGTLFPTKTMTPSRCWLPDFR